MCAHARVPVHVHVRAYACTRTCTLGVSTVAGPVLEPEEEAVTCEAGRGAWVADGGWVRTKVLGVRGLPGGRREPGDGAPAVSAHRTDSGTTAPPSHEVGQGLAGGTGVRRALCTGRLDFHGEGTPGACARPQRASLSASLTVEAERRVFLCPALPSV